MSSCDEFIFYDDLVAEHTPPKRRSRSKTGAKKTGTKSAAGKTEKAETRDDPAQQAIDLVIETTEALYAERGDRAKLWGSMIKQTLKRRRPGFNEAFYGFGSFSDLLEEAQSRGLLELEMDDRSGGYIIRKVTN